MLKIGDQVIYKGDVYLVIWVYDDGFYEIRHNNQVVLVEFKEISPYFV